MLIFQSYLEHVLPLERTDLIEHKILWEKELKTTISVDDWNKYKWLVFTMATTTKLQYFQYRFERGYNPETPSNFRYNSKIVPLDDTPT